MLFIVTLFIPSIANAAEATAWLVPSGMTSITFPGAPRGYSPFTGPGMQAFDCTGKSAWHGEDGDGTFAGVRLGGASTTLVGGLSYKTLVWSGMGPAAYPHKTRVSLSTDGVNYTDVATLATTLGQTVLTFNQWIPEKITWTPRQARFIIWHMDDEVPGNPVNSFTNMLGAKLLVPISTPKTC